jgi:3-oxoacyl-ACP reductase-like protein
MVAAFLAAFMSTIANPVELGQLSYLVNDFYKRVLVRPAAYRPALRIGHLADFATVVLLQASGYTAVVTFDMDSIASGDGKLVLATAAPAPGAC